MTNLEKLEYIHVTLQEQVYDCNINNDYYLDEMETSLKFVEELREPYLKDKGYIDDQLFIQKRLG